MRTPPALRVAVLAVIAVIAVAGASGAAAQPPGEPPARPRLRAQADLNDWEAYYDYGASMLAVRNFGAARAGFYWAARLDPMRADPLYGWWVTNWLRDTRKWERYLRDDERVVSDPEVRRADSVRMRALVRNPFVHQGIIMVLFEALPGRWGNDLATQAWIAYARPDFQKAAQLFGAAVARDPRRYGYMRQMRAASFVALQRYDSALAELTTLRSELEQREREHLVSPLESREMLEYAIARLHFARGDVAAARSALETAIVENVGFPPAHELLGEIALAQRDTATAVRELGTAVELDPGDAMFRVRYAIALRAARRPAEAVEQLRHAARAEPFYADIQFHLGASLEAAGDRAAAARAYEEYIARAPARDAADIARARQRLAALAVTAASPE
ncbi:MAG TPA: tetratricopeptide repeat protein [Gemmatimonadaceae bacterium]|nr:tetratricopeptide repeat protein [Gemmatimonadaceae bacterium]